ncbi:uncharacterized protein EI90DRAFT_3154787 [Cantharellus anzutake]|uniref:uncharacterized protein n=1 Tax=Cantharellus anzutake TaxID=1750568 RepID=UPI0019043E69|nr:uncharacterized protein EI90DRAFT_3154787 [Cantharellus anzutake]KAF8330713.1 hypothetical protein EI90DRAFT_3154787 [Cantharellus anzutake]
MVAVPRSFWGFSATAADLLFPRWLSTRLLVQKDQYAPHPSYVGFEGWYTRIQDESAGLSIILIFCSLGDSTPSGTPRKHYFHFSVTPIGDSSTIEPLEFHLFPDELQHIVDSPPDSETGLQPYTLNIPNIGSFTVEPKTQRYNLTVPCGESSSEHWKVSIDITDCVPLSQEHPLLSTPHSMALSRLETLLPLHWAIFSTGSKANYDVKHIDTDGVGLEVFGGTGVAHMEKNWGASFPTGWTWYQAFGDHRDNATRDCVAIAGGVFALGQKAYLIHYKGSGDAWRPRRERSIHPSYSAKDHESTEHSDLNDKQHINWTFRPLWTLILALPYPVGIPRFKISRKNLVAKKPSLSNTFDSSASRGPTAVSTLTFNFSVLGLPALSLMIPYAVIQFSPFGSMHETFTYDERSGFGRLQLTAATLNRWILVDAQSESRPATLTSQVQPRWLVLHCPMPGGHATHAYETFTARATIRAYRRQWRFGWPRWVEIRHVELNTRHWSLEDCMLR